MLMVLLLTVVNGGVSYAGGAIALLRKGGKEGRFFVPFTAGVLLAMVFFDMLPEALPYIYTRALVWMFVGVAGFFFLESLIERLERRAEQNPSGSRRAMVGSLVASGIVHNVLFGAVIALFATRASSGLLVALALALSDVPHEIGVFSVLRQQGLSKRRVLVLQAWVTAATMVGGVVGYGYRNQLLGVLPAMLAVVAGWFALIVVRDLFGTMRQQMMEGSWWRQVMAFCLGSGVVWWILWHFGYLLLGAHNVFVDHPM